MPLCVVSIAVFLFEQEWHWQQRSCYCTVITLGGFPELFPANAVRTIQTQEKDSVIKKKKKEDNNERARAVHRHSASCICFLAFSLILLFVFSKSQGTEK